MIEGSPSRKLATIRGVDIHFEIFHLLVVYMVSHWILAQPELVAMTQIQQILVVGGCVIATTISLLIHEFSHVEAARLFNINTKEVKLILLGAVAYLESTGKTAWQNFVIAAAGPAASFILYALFSGLSAVLIGEIPTILIISFGFLSTFNLVLAVFNLLPIFPMDGGRILVSFFWWVTGNYIISVRISSAITILLGVGFAIGSIYAGNYMLLLIMSIFTLINIPLLFGSKERILRITQ